jgi:hypothetical protein
MELNFDVKDVLERKPDVRLSRPREYVRQRIAESAAALNLAGQMAARVELVSEALSRLTELLYQCDSDGVPANIDAVTYRLLIPAPWGSRGWRLWGLRSWEAETLRRILRERQNSWTAGQRPPLYTYDDGARTWHLNAQDYPTLQAAHWWLTKSPITIKEWRQYAKLYRDTEATVRRRYRRG